MASSSVSQDDIDNDYEKNSRRSRIRTARARQINPSGSRADAQPNLNEDQELVSTSAGAAAFDLDLVEAVSTAPDVEHDTSPKPLVRTSTKDKRPIKLHHVNKGKQQRDRRKLREKRRSTGVVHLASTESTGGSTTGDDDGVNSDAVSAAGGGSATGAVSTQSIVGGVSLSSETKRNTQQNENIANSYRQAQEKLAEEVTKATNGEPSRCHIRSSLRRDKSPSDLEADDENDHDSLNQSETGSGSNLSVCNLACEQQRRNADSSATSSKRSVNQSACVIEQMSRENKRLSSLVEEKDKKIHLLEYKVQQLMRDTSKISEEQSRLQKENTTLLRALSKLTKDKAKS